LKKLFILSPFHYNFFINNINAVWVSKNLFRNGDLFFYFLTYNNFKIKIEHNIFKELELTDKPISYKIEPQKDNSTLDYLFYFKNNFDIYFIYPENVFSYSFQMYAFIKFFNIKKYYLKNNTDTNYLDEYIFNTNSFLEEDSINHKDKIDNIILKKVYITILSNIIFSFFYSKTTTQENIDLLFFLLDDIIKNNTNKKTNNIFSYEKDFGESKTNNLYKLIGNNLKYLYMYIDFESDTFNILNKDSYKELNYKYEFNDNIYYTNEEYNNNLLTPLNFNLNEAFLYLNDWYSIEEIYYKLLHIYEYINVNDKQEVVNYFSPISINIKEDLKEIQNNLNEFLKDKDFYTLHFVLNNFYNLLKTNYKEKSLELIKCPFCIDGKIYNGKDKFFCNKCNFFLIKSYIKRKYNFDLTKRYLKILIHNKYITINLNGENRILYLRQTDKGVYLILLRKK